MNHDACNTKQLLLSLGEVASVLFDDRIIPLLHPADKVVRASLFGGFHNHFLGDPAPSKRQILTNRPFPQPCFLQHHAVTSAQALSGHLPDIATVYQNASLIDIIESHQKIDHR